ncbi:O-antigen ligase family protein [Candidatus Laterigemmans baculatus]|uniref:O-antigen ligase family protein n=1 Tax=Candidatus Laterigemmans baculatus TaxID=2770505 RepID=UPI0013D97C0D|nr:hypothetical protein [Candidatus Laterigemmans baculatus]
MSYELATRLILAGFFGASALACLKRSPAALAVLVVAAYGMGGFNTHIGTAVSPEKVVTLASSGYLVFIDRSWIARLRHFSDEHVWYAVVGVFAALAAAYLLPFPQENVRSHGLQSPALRPLVQTYSYLSYVSLYPLAILAFSRPINAWRFLKSYAWLARLQVIVALYQLSGAPFIGINRLGYSNSFAAFESGGEMIRRLYAFAGEPKALAVFLLPAIFISLSSLAAPGQRSRRLWFEVADLGLLVFVFLFTFSTAGILALLAGGAYLLPSFSRSNSASTLRLVAVFALIMFGVVGGSALWSESRDGSSLLDALVGRSAVRLQDEAPDRLEARVLEYLFFEQPVGLFVGLGPGMYCFHLPGMTFAKGIVPINSGWVTVLADLGVVGLLYFGLWIYRVTIGGSRRSFRSTSATYYIAVFQGAFVAAVFLHMGTGALPFIFLFGGALTACRRWPMPKSKALAGKASLLGVSH